MDLSADDLELIMEALAKAASRHEAQGHVTQGRFRYQHDEKAARMRALRHRLRELPPNSPRIPPADRT